MYPWRKRKGISPYSTVLNTDEPLNEAWCFKKKGRVGGREWGGGEGGGRWEGVVVGQDVK